MIFECKISITNCNTRLEWNCETLLGVRSQLISIYTENLSIPWKIKQTITFSKNLIILTKFRISFLKNGFLIYITSQLLIYFTPIDSEWRKLCSLVTFIFIKHRISPSSPILLLSRAAHIFWKNVWNNLWHLLNYEKKSTKT